MGKKLMSETTKELEVKKADKIEGIQVLADTSLTFEHPREDVHIARMRIAGCGWVDTDDGVVLVDTLYSKEAAKKTLDKEELGSADYCLMSRNA